MSSTRSGLYHSCCHRCRRRYSEDFLFAFNSSPIHCSKQFSLELPFFWRIFRSNLRESSQWQSTSFQLSTFDLELPCSTYQRICVPRNRRGTSQSKRDEYHSTFSFEKYLRHFLSRASTSQSTATAIYFKYSGRSYSSIS